MSNRAGLNDLFMQSFHPATRTLLAATCLLLIGLAPLNAPAQKTDSVFLYNGQVLIGEVQGVNVGILNIDDVDLKTQKIKVTKIRKLRIAHTFKVETTDKHIYWGYVRPAAKDGWVNIIRYDTALLTIPITQINLLISLQKGFLQRLNGSVSSGFSYTKSNQIGQLTLSASAMYATRLISYQLTASENASLDSGKFSRDREDLEFFTDYNLDKGWFLAGLLQYQRNLELSIARRFQQLVGAGNKVFVRDNCQLLVITGISLSQELSTQGESSGPLWEIPLMVRFNFFQFSHPDIQISTSQTTYIGLTESGRIRFDGNTSFSWQLVRNFYIKLNPYTNYDNKPPSGSSNFDYGVTFSISYQF